MTAPDLQKLAEELRSAKAASDAATEIANKMVEAAESAEHEARAAAAALLEAAVG